MYAGCIRVAGGMSDVAGGPKYGKHFIPLESNPDVFTQLVHNLGISSKLIFTDVLSLDEPDLLAHVPRPVYALVLVFPVTETYEKQKADMEASCPEYAGCGEGEDIVWYKQTINNACGLYGILHAVSNGPARDYIEKDSIMYRLLQGSIPLEPHARALFLESSSELEEAHTGAALQGDTVAPNAEDEVNYHYVCFVRSCHSGNLYELDGDTKGPRDLGTQLAEGDDMLSEGALDAVRDYISREEGGDLSFALLALVRDDSGN